MYIVSSCLAGVRCRYDGKDNLVPEIKMLVEEGKAIPLCPEVMAGLSIPRESCEIVKTEEGERVIDKSGRDLTLQFAEGARMTAEIAKIVNAKVAIMKFRSPSCGCGKIYDGTFSGKLVDGDGFAVRALKEIGVEVCSENDFRSVLK